MFCLRISQRVSCFCHGAVLREVFTLRKEFYPRESIVGVQELISVESLVVVTEGNILLCDCCHQNPQTFSPFCEKFRIFGIKISPS